MNLELADYLLLALLLLVLLSFLLIRKFLSLLALLVGSYVKKMSGGKEGEDNASQKTLLHLKLSAYERMVLFTERMKPDSLIPRTLVNTCTNREYHQALLAEIRKEYEYNMSQQLYMTPDAWSAVLNLKNNIVTLVNTAAADCRPEEPGSELARKILEQYITSGIKADEIVQLLKADLEQPAM